VAEAYQHLRTEYPPPPVVYSYCAARIDYAPPDFHTHHEAPEISSAPTINFPQVSGYAGSYNNLIPPYAATGNFQSGFSSVAGSPYILISPNSSAEPFTW